MKNISNGIAAVMLLILALISLGFYMLQQNRVCAARNEELLLINDSIRSVNYYLTGELEKVKHDLRYSGKSSLPSNSGTR